MTDVPSAKSIKMFFHCARCMPRKPASISPEQFARINVGWTDLGLQVWCVRCDCNIVHIDFEGQKHPANVEAK